MYIHVDHVCRQLLIVYQTMSDYKPHSSFLRSLHIRVQCTQTDDDERKSPLNSRADTRTNETILADEIQLTC